jgi:hypothetical protein
VVVVRFRVPDDDHGQAEGPLRRRSWTRRLRPASAAAGSAWATSRACPSRRSTGNNLARCGRQGEEG